jgi:hypothetical protein
MTLSCISRNRVGDNIQPCLNLVVTSKESVSFPSWTTRHLNPSYRHFIMFTIFSGTVYIFITCQLTSLANESKALSKSTNAEQSVPFRILLCFKIIVSVLISSMQLHPFLNPACSFLRWDSNIDSILFKITFVINLLAIQSIVITFQLSHFEVSCFFGSFSN